MPNKISFQVSTRTIKGKKVSALRAQGLVPANVMSGGVESLMISMPQQAFKKLYKQVGDTQVIYLSVDGKEERPVLVEEVASHPVTGLVRHVVFHQVNLKEKIEAEVPVEVIGENKIPNTVILTVHDTITVEALPTDLPEKFVVDISKLTEVGQSITFADLDYDKDKVEIKMDEEMTSPVVILQEVKEEVEEAPVVAAEAVPGAEGGEAAPAAEGAAATDAKPEAGKDEAKK